MVVADTRSPRDGRFLERLGTYTRCCPRIIRSACGSTRSACGTGWASGALPSDRVARFLGAAEIIPMPAQRNNPQKGQPRAKALEREAARAKKAAAAAEAPTAAEAAPDTAAGTARKRPPGGGSPEEAAPEEAAPEEPAPDEAAAVEAAPDEAAAADAGDGGDEAATAD